MRGSQTPRSSSLSKLGGPQACGNTDGDHYGPFPWVLCVRRESIGPPGSKDIAPANGWPWIFSRLQGQNSPTGASAMAAKGKRSTRYFRFCKLPRDLARPIISWRERGAGFERVEETGKETDD